ncbi:MAG TPA: UvrD-helicase domain-containing protein [Alphaproteobacteria bacterium]|nr:UvrD-helicase domain-containing protein [Alphaproteobacteria bacterium]
MSDPLPNPFESDSADDAFSLPESEAPAPKGAALAARPARYLDDLNEAQRRAVLAVEGPVLVLAGAGTGKTRVLTTRLVHILNQGLARPWEVMAVTFTNKAARQMKERIERLLGFPVDRLWLGTFHALGARILRRHAEAAGLKSNFTILDADDQLRLVKQLLEAEAVDDKRWPARAVLAVLQRWKDRGLVPEKVPKGDIGEMAGGRLREIYAAYQERLRTLNACDFGDLLLHGLTLFSEHPEILKEYQERLKYVLVDEYQDTNVAQYLWLRLLAQKHKNICCVGDDDQSIYSWRGAEVGNILRFEKDFPGARIVRLEQNYRSSGHILGAASGLIAHNAGRLGKTLWTEGEQGRPISVRGLWDGGEEARTVGEEIEALQRAGTKLGEVAILVRAGFQTREFEERFIQIGLPYRVIGGLRFYERQEIRDAIAYFRVIVQPDDDLAFERIVNVPRRGIGAGTLQAIHRLARAERMPLTRAAGELAETDELTAKARAALTALLGDFARWRAAVATADHVELAETVLDESGYTAMWMADKSAEAPGRLENLKELVRALEEFESLAGFLEHVSLVMENESGDAAEQVSLMTLHAAKGLEFDMVFLPGWEEGLFPHQRALDEGGLKALEEERRLAYVGLTRARQRVYVSFAANRRVHNQWQSAIPSRFVEELPQDRLEVVTETGLYGGTGAMTPGASFGYVGGPGGYSGGQSGGYPAPARRRRAAEPDAPFAETARNFEVGERVFHQKFGNGNVIAVDGDKLRIEFDRAGEKMVIARFVSPV